MNREARASQQTTSLARRLRDVLVQRRVPNATFDHGLIVRRTHPCAPSLENTVIVAHAGPLGPDVPSLLDTRQIAALDVDSDVLSILDLVGDLFDVLREEVQLFDLSWRVTHAGRFQTVVSVTPFGFR